jgi:SAM-dependent methyltransferase
LDVGCNAGDLLRDIHTQAPSIRLSGVDVNAQALETARMAAPAANIRHASGAELPFESSAFDYATFIEVIEHIPADQRRKALEEIHRVLKPGATLLLRCPHAGLFDWLDSNNLRFHFPRLYGWLVGRGRRDDGYAGGSSEVVWHHHFSEEELLRLLEGLFRVRRTTFGAGIIFPIVDILRWPFYRKGLLDHPVLQFLERVANWDMGISYGRNSFTILLELERI